MSILILGGRIGNLAYINDTLKYLPKSQGFVNGIILGGGWISSSMLTPLADFIIINPEKEKTDKNGIYPEYISKSLPKFLLILLISFMILGAIALSISFPYEEEEDEKEKEEENEEKGSDKKNGFLKEALLSNKNLLMISFCFCGFCKQIFIKYILILLFL